MERQTFRIRGRRSTGKGGREAMEIYLTILGIKTLTILGIFRARGFPKKKKAKWPTVSPFTKKNQD